MTIYENSFNQNEWFIIIVLVVSLVSIMLLPKLEKPLLLVFLIYGITIGMFFDHTISIEPFNYYDVNDRSSYQIIDFISYLMFGPFAYFFVYFYRKFKVKGFGNIIYILIWAVFSIGLELVAYEMGVYHYRNGYRILFSIPIYIGMQSGLVIFYHLVMKDFNNLINKKT